MVSKIHPNTHYVSIPADWDLPKFHLGQRVRAKTVLPDTTRIQTGEISGLEYIKSDRPWVARNDIQPGWYYSIELDRDDPLYGIDPVLCLNESDIRELAAVP
jgi:hypothetical protein